MNLWFIHSPLSAPQPCAGQSGSYGCQVPDLVVRLRATQAMSSSQCPQQQLALIPSGWVCLRVLRYLQSAVWELWKQGWPSEGAKGKGQTDPADNWRNKIIWGESSTEILFATSEDDYLKTHLVWQLAMWHSNQFACRPYLFWSRDGQYYSWWWFLVAWSIQLRVSCRRSSHSCCPSRLTHRHPWLWYGRPHNRLKIWPQSMWNPEPISFLVPLELSVFHQRC